MFNFLNDNYYQLAADQATLSLPKVAKKMDFIAPLPQFSTIKIYGADAGDFLNRQLSNDVTKINQQLSQLNSYSSPKGMLYGNGRLYQIGDDFLLRVHSSIAQKIVARLSMFVLRDNLQMQICHDYLCFGAVASCHSSMSKMLGYTIDSQLHSTAFDAAATISTAHAGNSFARCELLVKADAANAWFNSRQQHAGNSEDYAYYQIKSGEAYIDEKSYEQHLAQFLNWDILGGIDFKKGCYPGQEYIARAHYRGRVRSRCYLIASKTAIDNHKIVNAQQLSAGTVLNSAQFGDKYYALAIIRSKLVENGSELYIDEQPISVEQLPYSPHEQQK